MALALEWSQAAPSGLLSANKLLASNLIVPKLREAKDLALVSLGNQTIDGIIKSVDKRMRFSQSSSNSVSDSRAIKRPAKRMRRRTIDIEAASTYNERQQQQQQQQQQQHQRQPTHLEMGYEEDDVQTLGSRRNHVPHYYQQMGHQQPTNMYNRQQQHKNLKPVHVSISQQTVNGLLSLLLLFIISICGCIGTIFIMSALTVIESLQTRGNCYLVSLALAQLLVNLFVIPSSALQIMAGDAGLNGQALCHYQWLTLEFSLIVSQLSFALIAADNYLGYCCSEKVITSVANFRRQQGHELVAQQNEEQHKQHRQCPPLHKEQEVSSNRAPACHLASVGVPQRAPLSAGTTTKLSEEDRELERRRAERQAHMSLQRDFLGQEAVATKASAESDNTRDETATMIKRCAAPNAIGQFFNYSFKRHREPPSGLSESPGAYAQAPTSSKSRIVSLFVSSPSKETREPQTGDPKLKFQIDASKNKDKPATATGSLARQFALETPGAKLKRPGPFNYRICRGRLRVLFWIIGVWSLAFAYIVHQHERSFAAKFCSITSTHYQPILPTNRRPALHRDSGTQTNLFPNPNGGIALRNTDDELTPLISNRGLAPLAAGYAEGDDQLRMSSERRLKRNVDFHKDTNQPDFSSVMPSSNEHRNRRVNSIRAMDTLLEHADHGGRSTNDNIQSADFRHPCAHKIFAHNPASALGEPLERVKVAIVSRDQRSKPPGRAPVSRVEPEFNANAPLVEQAEVADKAAWRRAEPVSSSKSEKSWPSQTNRPSSQVESGSQMIPNRRHNGLEHLDALHSIARSRELAKSGVNNNTRVEFSIQARSMRSVGRKNEDRNEVNGADVAQRPEAEFEISRGDSRRASGRGLTRIAIIDGSAPWRRKPHEGRDKSSGELAAGSQIAIEQTVEVELPTRPSASLVWPLSSGVHHFQRQLGTTRPASNLRGTDTERGADSLESEAMLESSSSSSQAAARRAPMPPASADVITERGVLSSLAARSEPEDKRSVLGVSLVQAPSMVANTGSYEVGADYNLQWRVASLASPADERQSALESATGLPIIADKTSEPTNTTWYRLADKAEFAGFEASKLAARPEGRKTRFGQRQIGPIIRVYSQCDGISCHRNSSTVGRTASWSGASATSTTSAWGSKHKVPTNDKWNDEKLAPASRAQRRPTRDDLGHDFSSTVHLNNDKQTSWPKNAPVLNDSRSGEASLAPDTKKRALMNNVDFQQFNVEASASNIPPAMQMASFSATPRSSEQIRRARRAYDAPVGLIDPHWPGADLALAVEPDASVASDLGAKERRFASGSLNNQLERPAELDGQRQTPAPLQTKDFFWPMLMGSIVLPSVLSSLLFLGAYFKMKEFKMRPYKPMPVNTIASTPPALLTPRSPIPLIAQRQVYAFDDDQPTGSSSKLASSFHLTADQLIGKSVQLNSGGGVRVASKLANEYAMLEGALSDSSSRRSSSSNCSTEHDDGELLARAAHATARRVSEAAELMLANKTINNKNNNDNNGGVGDKTHRNSNSNSPLGSGRRPTGGIRSKSKTIDAADDVTRARRGVAHANPHAQLNQVMSAPVNCVSLASYAARHIDEQAVSPEACYLPPSSAPLHATNDEQWPLGEARQVPAEAARFCPFRQPNHRAISFSAPPSANGHLQADCYGPAANNFSAREFTSYLRQCEMSPPLMGECGYPANVSIERKRHSSPVPFFRPIQEHEPAVSLHPLDRHQQHAHSFHSGTSAVPRNLRLVPQATLHEQQPTWPLESIVHGSFNQSAHTPRLYAGSRPHLSIQKQQQQQPLGAAHARSLIERNQSLERHRSLPANRRLALRERSQGSSQQRSVHSNLLSRHVELTQEQTSADRQAHSTATMMSRALASVIRSVDEGDVMGAEDNSKSQQQTIPADGQANQSSSSAVRQLRPASRVHSRSGPSGGSSGETSAHRAPLEHQEGRLSASDPSGGNTEAATSAPKIRVKPPNLSHLIAIGQSEWSDAANASPALHRTRNSVVPLEQRDISATADANSKVILCTYTYMTDEQLLKSNMIVFAVNLTLWVPFVALLIVLHYSDSISIEFKDSVWWFAVLNCCLCSYLYALTNKDFREAFNKLFYYICCKSHVTFQKKTPIFRRQLDVDQRGNLRVHIIPALNVYSNKLFAATSAPMAPDSSPTPNAPSRSPLLPGELVVAGALASSNTIDHLSHQARLIHNQSVRGKPARSSTSNSPKVLVDVH